MSVKKALLVNLLLCPGAGQFLLKRYKRAWLLTTTFLGGLVWLIYSFGSKLQPMVDKVLAGKLLLTQQAIQEELRQNPIEFDLTLAFKLTIVLISVWLISIIDCLRK